MHTTEAVQRMAIEKDVAVWEMFRLNYLPPGYLRKRRNTRNRLSSLISFRLAMELSIAKIE